MALPNRAKPFLALAGALLVCEAIAWVLLPKALPQLERTRRFLAGEESAQSRTVSVLPQAYLLYSPNPAYENTAGPQHNSQGYRGRAVPLRRTPGVARVLCMGGSTTYGEGSLKADESYPAYLEKALAAMPLGPYRGVEVINAGIPFGTTAEILTHYHFKFHYYRPDLVILNPGGNDALALMNPHYHPDYSHWRKNVAAPEALRPVGRVLMHSRLAAALLIPLFYGLSPTTDVFTRWNWTTAGPDISWYELRQGSQGPEIPRDEQAFLHNLQTAVAEMQADGARVLLVPFRPSPHNTYPAELRRAMALEWSLLDDVSRAYRVPVAPFPATSISPQNWVDNCHQNAAGYEEKARYLAPFARQALLAKK